MNVGDVIKGKVIAVGSNGNASFISSLDEKIDVPIIVNKGLKMKKLYKIKIIRITQNFIIGEAIDSN
jgi:hypothetical protein